MRGSEPPPGGRWLSAAAAAAAALFILLTIYDVRFVVVEKDEGFYAYAFRLVAEGRLPYRDFNYIESPALPYYYATILAIPGISLLSVRVLCALTGAAAIGLLALGAARLAGRTAAAVTLLILCTNARLAEWFSRDVTYPLVTLLLAAALLAEVAPRSPRVRMALQGALLGLTGAVKASMGIVSLVWMGALAYRRRDDRRALLAGALGFTAALALSVGPFLLADFGAFRYNVIDAALSRGRLFPFMSKPDSLDQWLEFGGGQKILAIRTVALWHFPLVVLGALVLLGGGKAPAAAKEASRPSMAPMALALIAGVLFHFLVPSPSYPNYQLMLMPTLAALLAVKFSEAIPGAGPAPRRGRLALPVVLGGLSLLAGIDPHEVGLQIGSFRHGPREDLNRLIARVVPPDGRLLTDYLPAAVEAGRHVVPGNEGGRASLVMSLPDEQAAAFHVLNRRSFLSILRNGEADGVLLTGQLFEESFRTVPGFLEEVESALTSRYDLVKEFPESVYFPYGRIRVFQRRGVPESPAAGDPPGAIRRGRPPGAQVGPGSATARASRRSS